MTDAKRVLYIDTSSSRCGVCGLGADPTTKTHETIMEYDAIRAMRPDLAEDFMTPFEALPLSGAEGTTEGASPRP